ncbi:MAG TPA: SIR2 family protein, partial [Saprospiraceae bacterium]|nr:SIR2 family protein [Saprospiraceae bacterium]
PFEPTFQRLETIAGPPVLSFVEALRKGAPNFHHFMLANAIEQGHTVVTTNFDERIEKAYGILYPDKKIRTVVSDYEFQQLLDQPAREGMLLKIHGTLDNYASLALTAQGIWSTSEFSVRIGDDIDGQKAEAQRALSHDESSLSIPKDLVLSKIMAENTVIFMGYSGSDLHDISPVIFSTLAERRIVWLSYDAGFKLPSAQLVIQPEQPEQMKEDIIHAVSAHWKRRRLNNTEPYPVEAVAKTSLSYEAFCDWLQRMSFRRGDGLAFLGEFFENNGHFELALACYEGACDRYATLPDGKKERRLLHTEFRIPFCLAYTGREEEAAEKQLAFIQSLEKQQLREQYPDVYASALLETAGRLVRSGQLAEGKKLWQKADRFSDEHRILHGKVYAESVQGAILYREGKVREASEHFLNALNGSSILGLAYGEARAAIDAAHCARDLGDRFLALKWSGMAQYAAQKSGDRVLQQYIEHDRQDIRAYFDFNHRIRQQSWNWETAFTALLYRVGVSFRRFRFLLASRDQKALDELFAALEPLPGPDAGQSAALSWFRIMAAFECGQRDAAQAMLRALSDFTGNCPLLELEL